MVDIKLWLRLLGPHMRAVLVVRNHWGFKSRMNMFKYHHVHILHSLSTVLHPDTWSYGHEEAKLFSISVVSQENFRIYWNLWVCSPWDETSPGRWLTPPLLSDSLFHILWISQLVSEFTSLQTWNICDIKHSWLSNRSVINDRTEEVITEDLFWTLNRPVFIILASLKMSLLCIYRSPWWLIDGFVIRVAWNNRNRKLWV